MYYVDLIASCWVEANFQTQITVGTEPIAFLHVVAATLGLDDQVWPIPSGRHFGKP